VSEVIVPILWIVGLLILGIVALAWLAKVLTTIGDATRDSVRRLRVRGKEHSFRHGRCAHCGYDLRATTHRCPECGHYKPLRPIF
jgi:predicted Zn-ribbon and HTH transcriptional regulator